MRKTFLDAAVDVLARSNRPLTAEEIVEKAQERGILKSFGATPARTMSAALYVEVSENPRSRFVRVAKPGKIRAVRNTVRWTLKK
jgi:hypothetical protein